MSNSSGSIKIGSLVTMIYRYRLRSRKIPSPDQHCSAFSSKSRFDFSRLSRTNTGVATKSTTDMVMVDDKNRVSPTVPGPVKPNFPTWAKWLLGSILSLFLPFWKQKWERLLILEGNAEKVVEEVENVAEVVEKVATTAEKVSAEIAGKLPDDGKLKEAALVVEHVSSVAAKDAQLTEDFIHKVEELEHDLKALGSIVEPAINKIMEKKNVQN